MGFAKIGCDAFALPDIYTYMLFRRHCRNYYFLVPFSLFTDIILSFPLGTFFAIDMVAYYVWRRLCRLFRYSDYAIVLYSLRYFLLYFVGVSSVTILNQLLYCIFFGMLFRVIRGAKHAAVYY